MFNSFHQVCLALGLLSWFTLPVDSKVSRDEMFPFGPSNGDSVLPECLSCYDGPVKLNEPILLSDQEYNELYVNTDGVISFNSGIDFYPETCEARSSHSGLLIAPFWTDVDTRRGGHVYYRQSTDRDILSRAKVEIMRAIPDVAGHPPMNSAFIVTWDNVSYARADQCSDTFDRNTFQAVLATDVGGSFFVLFYYNDLTWTGGLFGGLSSSCEWQLKNHASAGLSFGDEHGFQDILGSCPFPDLSLVNKSNVREKGKWIFQLDNYFTEKGSSATAAPTTTTGITTKQSTTTSKTVPTGMTSPTVHRVRPTSETEIVLDNTSQMSWKLKHMMRRVMSFISLNFVI